MVLGGVEGVLGCNSILLFAIPVVHYGWVDFPLLFVRLVCLLFGHSVLCVCVPEPSLICCTIKCEKCIVCNKNLSDCPSHAVNLFCSSSNAGSLWSLEWFPTSFLMEVLFSQTTFYVSMFRLGTYSKFCNIPSLVHWPDPLLVPESTVVECVR